MRGRWLAGIVVLLLLFSGCAFEAEPYLRPPQAQGQQQAVLSALEAAIEKKAGGVQGYVLKYPRSGTNVSPFMLFDTYGMQTVDDKAVLAVAFYALHGENTHIHLLRREDAVWYSVADTVGESAEIDRVFSGDLDGDGTPELLVGWSVYGKSQLLSVYRLQEDALEMTDAGRYTDCFVGDMNDDGRDEIVRLQIDNQAVTATLSAWMPQTLSVLGTVHLDSAIVSFEKLTYGKLSNGQAGLYIDAMKRNGVYITELIYWNGENMAAPLYDRLSDSTTVSARTMRMLTADINGDGVPEFPAEIQAEGVAGNACKWIAEWYGWDVTAGVPVRQFATVVNSADGYLIELEDAWIPALSVQYDTERAILWLEMMETDGRSAPILAVRNLKTAQDATTVADYDFEPLAGDSLLEIWYDEENRYHLDAEKISYMLVPFS